MNEVWRLINTGQSSAVENMAIDEALLHHFDPLSSKPILRLYGWNPPALSIGRFQKVETDIDIERLRADGTTVVRRITGGGAIFHCDEITYSLVCSSTHVPHAKSVKESFRTLT